MPSVGSGRRIGPASALLRSDSVVAARCRMARNGHAQRPCKDASGRLATAGHGIWPRGSGWVRRTGCPRRASTPDYGRIAHGSRGGSNLDGLYYSINHMDEGAVRPEGCPRGVRHPESPEAVVAEGAVI